MLPKKFSLRLFNDCGMTNEMQLNFFLFIKNANRYDATNGEKQQNGYPKRAIF